MLRLTTNTFLVYYFYFLVLGLGFQRCSSYPSIFLQGDPDVTKGNSTSGIHPRSEDDDSDKDKRKIQGVNDIVLGAFQLDLKKLLNGAFSFANKNIRNNVLDVILGNKQITPEPSAPANITEAPKTHQNLTALYGILDFDPFAPRLRQTSEPPSIDIRGVATTSVGVEGEDDDDD